MEALVEQVGTIVPNDVTPVVALIVCAVVPPADNIKLFAVPVPIADDMNRAEIALSCRSSTRI